MPGTCGRFRRSTHYVIDAKLDLIAATITGTQSLTYTHTEAAPLAELVLRLWPNAKTIYGGGSLAIEQVKREDQEVAWRIEDDPTVLAIPLEPPLEAGETATLEIAFVGQIPRSGARGYRIYHTSDTLTSLAGWHPMLAVRQNGAWNVPAVPHVGDANLAAIGLYEVTLRAPTGYQVVATGVTTGREETNQGVLWHIVSGPARDLTIMLSNRLEHRQAIVNNVTINLYTLANTPANVSAQTALDLAVAAFQVFQERFGTYPFAELDLVETAVTIGGYEFSGLVALEQSIRQHGSFSYFRWLVAHEIAHQWWYGLVGNDSVAEPWLDESFSTYSVVLYLEATQGKPAAQAVLNSYLQSAGRPVGTDSHIVDSALDFGSWSTYRDPIYYQGALFLAALRDQMGDEAFFELIQRYQASYRFRQATTQDFLALARELTDQDLDPLITRWFGSPAPE